MIEGQTRIRCTTLSEHWLDRISRWSTEPINLIVVGLIGFSCGYVLFFDGRLFSLFSLFDLIMVKIGTAFNIFVSLTFVYFLYVVYLEKCGFYRRINFFLWALDKKDSVFFWVNLASAPILFGFLIVVVFGDVDAARTRFIASALIAMFSFVGTGYVLFIVSILGPLKRNNAIPLALKCFLLPMSAMSFAAVGGVVASLDDIRGADNVSITMASGTLFGRNPIYTTKGVIIFPSRYGYDYSFIPFDAIQRVDRVQVQKH